MRQWLPRPCPHARAPTPARAPCLPGGHHRAVELPVPQPDQPADGHAVLGERPDHQGPWPSPVAGLFCWHACDWRAAHGWQGCTGARTSLPALVRHGACRAMRSGRRPVKRAARTRARARQVSEHASWSVGYYGRMVEAVLAAAGAPPNLVQFVTGYAEAGNALVTGGGWQRCLNKQVQCHAPHRARSCHSRRGCCLGGSCVQRPHSRRVRALWRGDTRWQWRSLTCERTCTHVRAAACRCGQAHLHWLHASGQEGHGRSGRDADARDAGAGGQGPGHFLR